MTDKPQSRKRRGRGEGGVFQRADGAWVGTISLGFSGNGKRRRKTVYGKTKKEVLDKLEKAKSQGRAGVLQDVGSLTIAQLLDRWLESRKVKIGARTHEAKESLVRVHLKPRIGGVKLAKLNGIHVEGLLAELRDDAVKPWAARHAVDCLDYALNYAVKLKLIAANPCHSIEKPRPKTPEVSFLTAAQAKLVREMSAGLPVHPLLSIALGTGCRQGELLALGWGDVDLGAGTVTIRRSLSMTKAGFVAKEPKTAASRRSLSLPDFAREALVSLKADRMKAGQLAAPIFCTRTGNYLNKNNVLRAFRSVVAKVNKKLAADEGEQLIPDTIRFHDLRHTVASILLSNGHSLRAVSQRLGHSNPALTLRVYSHCLPGDDGRLADGLAKLLG